MLVSCACGRCDEKYEMVPGTQRFLNRKGYWMVACRHHPRSRYGYMPEHILVKERNLPLGSYLHPTRQQVHHIDQNKRNNDRKNLQVVTPHQHLWIHIREWNLNRARSDIIKPPTYLAVDGEIRKGGALIP